jgi:hypothetical protein
VKPFSREGPLDEVRDRRLPCAGEPGEPHDDWPLPLHRGAGALVDVERLEVDAEGPGKPDVACRDLGLESLEMGEAHELTGLS